MTCCPIDENSLYIFHAQIHARMYLQRSIPLKVYNTNSVPDRLEGDDRRTVKAGSVLTYQIMIENYITMQVPVFCPHAREGAVLTHVRESTGDGGNGDRDQKDFDALGRLAERH